MASMQKNTKKKVITKEKTKVFYDKMRLGQKATLLK